MNKIQHALLSRLPENTDLPEITTVVIALCLGDSRDLEDGSHERLAAGIKDLVPRKTLIIQTGGTSTLPLCDFMFDVVKRKRPNWATQFLSIPLGWGTRSEIANGLAIIEALNSEELDGGINIFHSDFKVVFSTNKAHLNRVRWFVEIYNEHKIKVEFREAHHDFSLRSTIREYVGTPLIKIKDLFLGSGYLNDIKEDRFQSFFE